MSRGVSPFASQSRSVPHCDALRGALSIACGIAAESQLRAWSGNKAPGRTGDEGIYYGRLLVKK
jgi:hypothetical protein